MAGYQFFRLECYSKVTGKGKAGGHNLRNIADECERQEGACPHVKNPVRPKIIYGFTPSQVTDIAEDRASRAKDATGKRRLRKDALIAVCGVAPFPYPTENVRNSKELQKLYLAWEKDSVEFILSELGISACGADKAPDDTDIAVSISRHTDENFVHYHIQAIPPLIDGKMSVENLHPGRQASGKAKREGKKKGEQNRAYIEAMKAFQDRYSEVASKYGMARIGPKVQRLTRKEWHQQQRASEAILRLNQRAEKLKQAFKNSLSKAGQKLRDLVIQSRKLENDLQQSEVNQLKTQNMKLTKQVSILQDTKSQLINEREEAFAELRDLKGRNHSLDINSRSMTL